MLTVKMRLVLALGVRAFVRTKLKAPGASLAVAENGRIMHFAYIHVHTFGTHTVQGPVGGLVAEHSLKCLVTLYQDCHAVVLRFRRCDGWLDRDPIGLPEIHRSL